MYMNYCHYQGYEGTQRTTKDRHRGPFGSLEVVANVVYIIRVSGLGLGFRVEDTLSLKP